MQVNFSVQYFEQEWIKNLLKSYTILKLLSSLRADSPVEYVLEGFLEEMKLTAFKETLLVSDSYCVLYNYMLQTSWFPTPCIFYLLLLIKSVLNSKSRCCI